MSRSNETAVSILMKNEGMSFEDVFYLTKDKVNCLLTDESHLDF
jgi:hypothetical protein